ncbi:uncharacterized protein LOC134571263 [Pelobates fuscus]|uniref:uncharacterized protein LOC134571263 n=1 Tax=Pelobates fuscus TaxID=191477 RepID=UPI002FE452C3
MTDHLFKSKTFSSVYQKYMVPVSTEVINLIFSYMEEKQKSKPYDTAVDVGCGPGRYTLPLAPYFKKVIGVDISKSQIWEAKQYCTLENVTFQVAAAENLPLEDSSVDLVNAGLAAHWFNMDKFVHEAIRVLKPNGCLALHAFVPIFKLQDDRNDAALNAIMKQYLDKVSEFKYEIENLLHHQYEEVFNAIPLKDKKWQVHMSCQVAAVREGADQEYCSSVTASIDCLPCHPATFTAKQPHWTPEKIPLQLSQRVTDIPVVYERSIEEIIGFFQSVYMYQEFLKHDENEAIGFLMHLEQRFHDILGEGSESALLKLHCKHYCVLACKPSGTWRNNGLEN